MKKLLLTCLGLLSLGLTAGASTQYKLVTSLDNIETGKEYVMAYSASPTAEDATCIASGDWYSTHKFITAITSVACPNGVITLDDDSSVVPVTIEAGTTSGSYAIKLNGYYISVTGIANNSLANETDLAATCDLSFLSMDGNYQIKMNPVTNGNSGACLFQCNANNGQERFSNYKTGAQKNIQLFKKVVSGEVEAPQFTPAGGTYYETQSVTITCSTDGATIEYSFDETNWTAYTEPVSVSSSCTLYARATLNGVTKTNSATYVITTIPEVSSIADMYEKMGRPATNGDESDEFIVNFDAVATMVSGNNKYIYDNQGGYGMIYKSFTCEAGQVIKGGYHATIKNFRGLLEIIPVTTPTVEDGGTIPAPKVLAANEITTDNQGIYGVINGVVYAEETPSTATSFTGTVDGTEITFYNTLLLDAQNAGTYNVTGIISVYDAAQFIVMEYEDVTPEETKCADPVFTPEQGEVVAGTVVTVTCKTEDATFVYTINDGEVLTAAFPFTYTVTEDVVIEGYATKTGLEDSDVVTAAYTVVTAVSDVFVSASCTDVEGVTITNQDPSADLPSSGGSSATLNCVDKTFEGSTCDLQFQYVTGGSYSCVFTDGLRWYKNQTFTVTPHTGYTILGVEINTTAQSYVQSITVNLYDSTTEQYVAASEACVLDKTNNMITWTGEVAKNQAIQAVSSAQIRLNYIKVTTTDGSDGVSDIVVDNDVNAPVEYYNLQGIRVANPAAGQLLIRRQGNNVSKILF